VLVIEHNLDVIKTADWVIDLGPGGGIRGGLVIGEGTPEAIARIPGSATGEYLARVLRGEPLVPLSDVTFAEESGRGTASSRSGSRARGPAPRPGKRAAAATARGD
jgi:excinuclease ABC subunit A